MPQRSVRFSDDLHAAIEAEAERRGKPHTFSSVLIEWAVDGYTQQHAERASRPTVTIDDPPTATRTATPVPRVEAQHTATMPMRGSPSPSLQRFAGGVPKKGGKR